MELFAEIERSNRERQRPLAARMRPRTLEEFAGQEDFLSEGKLLRRMLQAKRIGSAILYGPPGVGKTSLAHLIAQHIDARFVDVNATTVGVKDVRTLLEEARDSLASGGPATVLFLDEIHRFNRSQQDILLPDVENGVVTLIGATTQNPFFSINAPLLSRSQIFTFKPLSVDQIKKLLHRAITDRERGFGSFNVEVTNEALDHWAILSDGDARRALTALEIAVKSFPVGAKISIDRTVAEESIQRKAVVHDGTGDEHYDLASAYIKSMRGSDPNAAIYWLARMLEAGEDPRFISRRLVIFASEDIGLADPQALPLAMSACQAVEFVGLPECQHALAHATLYLARAPKSNSAPTALGSARADVLSGRTLQVPPHLKDSHYSGAKKLGAGQGYRNPHQGSDNSQTYVPTTTVYFSPNSNDRPSAD